MSKILSTPIVLLYLVVGCTSGGQDVRRAKLNCYNDELSKIRETSLYREVMTQFVDTFKIMKGDKRYFGVPEIVSNKIDQAIFFNRNKTKCLLIALLRDDYHLVFGTARVIRGTFDTKRWHFKPSIEYVYSKDHFEGYPENSFENISQLARYSVLTDGEVKRSGCAIDEYYWFVQLTK